MNPDLYPAIVALVSLAANIAANHPKSDSILQTVRTRYAATALADTGCCTAESCCGTPLTLSAALGYSAEELAAVPEGHRRHRTVHQSAGGLVAGARRKEPQHPGPRCCMSWATCSVRWRPCCPVW